MPTHPIEQDVVDAIQSQADEVGITVEHPQQMAAFAQSLAAWPVGDVTVLACFLLAAAKTASDRSLSAAVAHQSVREDGAS